MSAEVDASPNRSKALPTDFLWGTAISAHQSEGGNINSDAWLLEHSTPSMFHEPSGDACDSYHRYGEDIALAASLGFNCHRLGIEWARIEPEPGVFSIAELDHYARVLETCRAHGLKPMVTFTTSPFHAGSRREAGLRWRTHRTCSPDSAPELPSGWGR